MWCTNHCSSIAVRRPKMMIASSWVEKKRSSDTYRNHPESRSRGQRSVHWSNVALCRPKTDRHAIDHPSARQSFPLRTKANDQRWLEGILLRIVCFWLIRIELIVRSIRGWIRSVFAHCPRRSKGLFTSYWERIISDAWTMNTSVSLHVKLSNFPENVCSIRVSRWSPGWNS